MREWHGDSNNDSLTLIHSLIHSLTHSLNRPVRRFSRPGWRADKSHPPHLLTTRTSPFLLTHSLTHSLTLFSSYTSFFVLLTITILRRRGGTLTHSLTHSLTAACRHSTRRATPAAMMSEEPHTHSHTHSHTSEEHTEEQTEEDFLHRRAQLLLGE